MRCRSSIAALVAAAALGCSSKEFQGDGGEAGDSGMGGTATGGSGAGGSNGGAGMSSGGSSGSAGGGGTPCTCPPTEYCRGGQCFPCSELATLDFGEPELVLSDPSQSLRFPRTGDTPSSLFYRAGNDGAGRLHYTANATTAGTAIGNDAVPEQSGPLFVGALDRSFNVIFDQTSNEPTGDVNRIMRAATWNGSALTGETDMPAPLSPGGHDDYSAAAATELGRLFWMSTRNGPPVLRTGMIDTGDGDTVVMIDVPKRTGTGTCPRDGDDATPWVTPEGHRMFFRAFPVGDTCQPLDAATTDLFVVPLEPASGIPTLPAAALASLNEVGSTETDPSLSLDFCAIYFASDRGSPGAFKLYRAPRR